MAENVCVKWSRYETQLMKTESDFKFGSLLFVQIKRINQNIVYHITIFAHQSLKILSFCN